MKVLITLPEPFDRLIHAAATMNCVNCVITTDQVLDGVKVSAALDGPKPIGLLESYFGSSFAPISGQPEIEAAMTAAGDGARGVVFASPGPGQVGHVFNVVNQGGAIRFLDGQPGTTASFDGYSAFYFMRYR
jgi:filamentous hemagglutinin